MGLTIDYDGRRFSSSAAETAASEQTPIGHYHQRGELVWAEFSGGAVRRGSLAGIQTAEGGVEFAYCQVLTDGTLISGRCVSHPEMLSDGRLRLREEWQRFGDQAASGVSYVEEIDGANPAAG